MRRAAAPRLRRAPDEQHEPNNSNSHDNPSERRRRPGTDERRDVIPKRHPRARGIAQEDVEPRELLCSLYSEGGAIRREAPMAMTSGIAHASSRSRTSSRCPAAHGRSESVRRSSSTTASSGSVSQIVCVRMPTASPAINAPATIQSARLPDRRCIGRVGASPADERRHETRLCARAMPSRHVAERAQRRKPEQRRCDDNKRRQRCAALAV